jgi:formamidase
VPNAVATLAVPIAIFDQDVRPKKGGPPVGPQLVARGDVARSPYGGSAPLTVNLCMCSGHH